MTNGLSRTFTAITENIRKTIKSVESPGLRYRESPWSSGQSGSVMVQKFAVKREFGARLRHATTGKLSLSAQQYMVTFFQLGKDKAAKGEGWALPFISCAQDTMELQSLLPLRLLGHGKPLLP